MAQSKEVAKKEETGVAEFNPAMFEADAGGGLQDLGQEDLALPFLKVLSGNDPVLDVNDDARKGDIYNTVTGALYKGKTGIRVIPCAYQRRFIQWAPRGVGSGAPTAIYEPTMLGQKLNVLRTTTKITWLTGLVNTSKKRISTLLFCLQKTVQWKPL
jgi:hypothetical protein